MYAEPFAGGAGAALGLLIEGFVQKIILNDIDPLIFHFWNSVLNYSEELIKLIFDTPININEWQKQRQHLKDEGFINGASSIEIGFSAFYMNRCNHSGILRQEIGPIGGKNQNSQWRIDARFNKSGLIKRIEIINAHKANILISSLDAVKFMKDLPVLYNIEPEKTLIYLDPPYYENGDKLYRNYFNDGDHRNLQSFLENELLIKWILSYDDVPFINNLYKNSKKNGFLVNHYINRAKIGKELIILSDNCIYKENIFNTTWGIKRWMNFAVQEKIIIQPNFKKSLEDLRKSKIRVLQSVSVDPAELSVSRFPIYGNLQLVEDLSRRDLDPVNGQQIASRYYLFRI